MSLRLLALDVDGTLLDPSGELTASTQSAVRRARDAGLEVVLCTGRRYRTARPVLRALGIDGDVVVQNGVVVKRSETGETVEHAYLPSHLYNEVLSLMREVGPPLAYVDPADAAVDIVTESIESGHAFQQEYLRDQAEFVHWVDSMEIPPESPVIMLSSMADEASLRPVESRVAEAFGGELETNFIMNSNYRGYILEVVRESTGKWPALERIAAAKGIAPSQIAAIGDDANDAEMVARAGLGIAMGNAIARVLELADEVAPSNGEDGVASAIDRWVLPRASSSSRP
jgi:Cof subfamily protein (haloacid dehalogenase superfamily)